MYNNVSRMNITNQLENLCKRNNKLDMTTLTLDNAIARALYTGGSLTPTG